MALTDPSQEEGANGAGLIVVQGIATGSLLYVVFFEILEKERQKPIPGLVQVRVCRFSYEFDSSLFYA